MEELIDNDMLDEVLQDTAYAGMDQKATNNLLGAVIRGSISSRAAAARKAEAEFAKAQMQQRAASDLRTRLLDMAGPDESEKPSSMPITYGKDPQSGRRMWNNLGWISDKPEELSGLPEPQRSLAARYNAGPLAEAQANAAGPTIGRQDPFRPPSAVILQHQQQVEGNKAMLRKMLDASMLMTQAKIPAQIQDLVLYQMFPEAARRKLEEDIKRLREREAIEGPRKDAALDARLDKDDRNAEYQRENVRLRRSAEHDRKVKSYEDLKSMAETAKRSGRFTQAQIDEMEAKLANMGYEIIMSSESMLHNQPYGSSLPPDNTQLPDRFAGVTGAGAAETNPYVANPDWWKNEPGAKTKTQTDKENLAKRQLDETKRNSPGDTATIQRLEQAAGVPRVVTNPDGSRTHPGFENSKTNTKVPLGPSRTPPPSSTMSKAQAPSKSEKREFSYGRDKVTKERIR